MRLNQFLAQASGLSRRAADTAIEAGRVKVRGELARLGQAIDPDRVEVALDGEVIRLTMSETILFNKPVGVVTSRAGQGNQTIYDLLPAEFHNLKPAGRLDRDTSGLIILTNDGKLANRLIHPSAGKSKRYQVKLNRPLAVDDQIKLNHGVKLDEGISRLELISSTESDLIIELTTGWNRQIRRSFAALGYQVVALERLAIGQLELAGLEPGQWRRPTDEEATWLV